MLTFVIGSAKVPGYLMLSITRIHSKMVGRTRIELTIFFSATWRMLIARRILRMFNITWDQMN